MSFFRKFFSLSKMPLNEFTNVPFDVAIVGMGCFWGVESLYGVQKGVLRTCVGYTGGKTTNPTYRDLENHTEVVKIEYDPTVITFANIVDIFFNKHDPTAQFKPQYMSAIFCQNDEQNKIAQDKLKEAQSKFQTPVVTKILSKSTFYPAELYHQKYRLQCNKEISALASKAGVSDVITSHVAARINGYLGGQGSLEQLQNEDLGLTPELSNALADLIKKGINVSCH